MPDTESGVGLSSVAHIHGPPAWTAALEEARLRVQAARVRYPYAHRLRAEVVLKDEEDEEEAETKAERKARKLAEKALQAQTQQMAAVAAQAATKALEDVLEAQAKNVDPKKRPDFQSSDDGDADSSPQLPERLKGLTPGGLRGHSVEVDQFVDQHVTKAIVNAINVNRFPRDMDAKDFCISRYCMAVDKFPYEGERAYAKYAPKESGYYQALESYGKEAKALGEYVSGQDGGFLAPEIWTNVFFDINGVACR